MAGDPKLDEFGLCELFSGIKSNFAETCLKPISDGLDMTAIAQAQQLLRVQLGGFSKTFESERGSVAKVLKDDKTFQRFSKPTHDFDDLCQRIVIILPNEREIKTLQTQKGSMKRWLIASLLMKSDFIVAYTTRFIEEIEELSQNTWYWRVSDGDTRFVEFSKAFDQLRLLKDMQKVLYDSVTEYIDLKAHLYSDLGRYSNYRPMVTLPSNWLRELEQIRVDFALADESAIYHVRTALELMLQITLKYFQDPDVEKYSKRITVGRVMEACKDVGIQLPVTKDLVERVFLYSNMSLHRGRRVEFSNIWYINQVLRDHVSPQMESLSLEESVLKAVRNELKKDKNKLFKIKRKFLRFLSLLGLPKSNK